MKINKYTLNSLITALILAIALIIFFFVIKAPTKKVKKVENKVVEQITISFDADGVTNPKDIKINKGDTVKLPTVTKDGYEFMGWYLNDTKVSNKTEFIKDTKLKAKWSKKEEKKETETFTVTFDSKGGSKVNSIKVECDKELSLPTNPTKEGYEFVSWVDKNDKPILNGALLTCDDITLYANWKKKEEEAKTITISFNSNGGSSVSTITNFDCSKGIILPNNPTKDNYEFINWTDEDGNIIKDGTKFICNEDVILTANWKEVEKKEEPKEEPKEEEKTEEEENKDNN